MQTEADEQLPRCGVGSCKHGKALQPGTFEPWLAGDRQSQQPVAKKPDPLPSGFGKSVYRELPRMMLAA
jgi:hypothetical protein